MKEFTNVNDILDFAIENEQNAVDFYNGMAKIAHSDDMRKTFEQFAREEMGHKSRLVKIKKEGILTLNKESVSDLKIADYIVQTEATSPNITYEQALVMAMKKEKAAFKLYMNLSERVLNENLKQLFHSLAQEELRHKLRFEQEYDEFVLKDN